MHASGGCQPGRVVPWYLSSAPPSDETAASLPCLQTYYGWIDYITRDCTFPAIAANPQVSYAKLGSYDRLCAPSTFSFLCDK